MKGKNASHMVIFHLCVKTESFEYGEFFVIGVVKAEARLLSFGYGAKEIYVCIDGWEKINSQHTQS